MTAKKVAVISGGLGGIGFAIARRLAEEGFTLACLSKNVSRHKVAPLKNKGHLFLDCDLTKQNDIKKSVAKIRKQLGEIDVCVHCAVSPILRKKFLDTSAEEFRNQFEVALFGGFELMQQATQAMKQRGSGRLIAITSAGIEPNAAVGTMPAYIAAKFALRGLLREMAKELGKFNITVNAVAPGFVNTGLNKDVPARMQEFLKEKNIFKKLTGPEDVAGVVAFLCSKDAACLTGLHIPVTFGEIMTL